MLQSLIVAILGLCVIYSGYVTMVNAFHNDGSEAKVLANMLAGSVTLVAGFGISLLVFV